MKLYRGWTPDEHWNEIAQQYDDLNERLQQLKELMRERGADDYLPAYYRTVKLIDWFCTYIDGTWDESPYGRDAGGVD